MKKILLALIILSFVSKAQPITYTATLNNPPAGYYFVSPYKGVIIANPTIYDGSGNIVYYKKITGTNALEFKLHANGLMSYFLFSLGKFIVFDSTFLPIDTVGTVSYTTNEHEFQILANGHYLMLADENSTQNLSSYHYFNHIGNPGSTSATVKSNIIQELDENKNIVFEWHHKDNFPFDETDPFFLSSPLNVDWSHSNAIELDQDGNILMSSRHFNEITKINHTTGNIMWHFGGKYNQFTFTTDTTPFYGQHDIRRLNNGHISFYDDANHTIYHAARAVEYELDEINMTAKLVWSYKHDSLMYSTSQGSVQILSHNTTLVDYGATNKDSVCFSMVDSLGNELFRMKYNGALVSYRAHYYPSLPWQINRPTISCFDSLGTFYLKVDSSYSSYLWNKGDTTRAIPLTDTGTYFVFVPYGSPNGFVSSLSLKVSNINSICGTTTSITGIKNDFNYRLFPNPAQNQITLYSLEFDKNTNPIINDMLSNRVELPYIINSNNTSVTFDISKLSSGLYFLNIKNKALKFIKE
ncbi:MAG TPA: aryl-sulfate sulfotransferase [Bacteroidia bacterium]|nr:aryl-sulfate sulfotransferase [Bacteroidia bacterium]